jgi:hypothetical protein
VRQRIQVLPLNTQELAEDGRKRPIDDDEGGVGWRDHIRPLAIRA